MSTLRPVSRETQIANYLALLVRWSRALALTSNGDLDEKRLRDHVNVSLAVIEHLPPDISRIIDLGSGQGFPAIPIAIATQIEVNLIESDKRKAAFLTTVMARLKLRGTVWPSRIEAISIDPASCITARALAPLEQLLQWAKPMLALDGCCLFLKGVGAEAEIAAAKAREVFTAEILPAGDPPSCLVKVTTLR